MRILPTLAFCALCAPADAARGETAATTAAAGPVMEIVTFRLMPGTDADTFLRLARATEAPLRRQPGFLARRLVQGADGEWTDLVEWTSLAAATEGAAVLMADPAFGPFAAAIDMSGLRMAHPALVWRMD